MIIDADALAFRKAWVEALESGKYIQHFGSLYGDTDGEACAIGCGALELKASGVGADRWLSSYDVLIAAGYVSKDQDFYDNVIGDELMDHIVAMNDKRWRDLKFIARFLRKVWQL